MFFRVDMYDRRSPEERLNLYDVTSRIYLIPTKITPFIFWSYRLNRLYLRSHHDYMPVLLLPHIMAKKASKIYGRCAGNTLATSFDSWELFKNEKPIVPEILYKHWDMTSNIHSQAVAAGLYQHRYLYNTQYFDIVARQL